MPQQAQSAPKRSWRAVPPPKGEFAAKAYHAATAALKSTPVEFRQARSLANTCSVFERLLTQMERLHALGVTQDQLAQFEVRLREFRVSLAGEAPRDLFAMQQEALAAEYAGNAAEHQVMASPNNPGALLRYADILRDEAAKEIEIAAAAEQLARAIERGVS